MNNPPMCSNIGHFDTPFLDIPAIVSDRHEESRLRAGVFRDAYRGTAEVDLSSCLLVQFHYMIRRDAVVVDPGRSVRRAGKGGGWK